MSTNSNAMTPVGGLLRTWRERRRLSQLELAGAADISARHISFLETGRSAPSRGMLLRLAERLEIPLRERNALLLSAGYAPMYAERRLDDPALQQARKAVELVIAGHEPYPALAVDRHWTLVSANAAVGVLLAGIEPRMLEPPVNVLRLGMHPEGLARRIGNYVQWREHTLARLRQQIAATADPILIEMLAELESYPQVTTVSRHRWYPILQTTAASSSRSFCAPIMDCSRSSARQRSSALRSTSRSPSSPSSHSFPPTRRPPKR
jgi:transcriptional regulator with XRE-family HTH domain